MILLVKVSIISNMSFNKYYIPEPEDFAKRVTEQGPRACVNRKIDAIIGNPTSIKIFDFIYEELVDGQDEKSIGEKLVKKFPKYFSAKPN